MFNLQKTFGPRLMMNNFTACHFASMIRPALKTLKVEEIRPLRNAEHLLVSQSAFQRPFIIAKDSPFHVPIFSLVTG